ncbi:MAG: OmpA family protein [Acidobacteriota bacterium]|nr:OmpA family protein [Acidobacteriota bacterium]
MSRKSAIGWLCVWIGAAALTPSAVRAQAADASVQPQASARSSADQSSPLYSVTVEARSTKAINYRHAKGSTTVGFKGTVLAPFTKGEAKVETKRGVVSIEAKFEKLLPATQYGGQFLTYVLWAVTPEGRASNLGELEMQGSKAKVDGATEFQAFAMIVSAEPYFAVSQPSDVVVMTNEVRPDTIGNVEQVDAKLDLLQHADYGAVTTGSEQRLDPRIPLSVYEARNAVAIAESAGAPKYAAGSYAKAMQLLQAAEAAQKHKADKKSVDMEAREAVQTAEDARSITQKRIDDERADAARRAAEAREQAAKEQAEAAEKAKLEAQLEAEKAAREKADAEAAQAQALAQQQAAQKVAELAAEQKAQAEAEAAAAQAKVLAEQQAAANAAQLAAQQKAEAEAEAERAKESLAQSEREKTELRAQLLKQLSMVLQTQDSARGLIVNMSDVLFDTGSYTLRAGAREKLAKISGILVAYPGLKVQVEGYTDSTGTMEFNQQLSEQRAGMVRDYLIDQMVPASSVTARGFGESQPIATNYTAEGRQQNRRVQLVVTGDAIGDSVDNPPPMANNP